MLARLVALLLPLFAQAHPMDLGALKVRVIPEGRLALTLRLHELAVAKFTVLAHPPRNDAELGAIAEALFKSTLGSGTPVLGGDTCHWRDPSLQFAADDHQFAELSVVAVCLNARRQPFSLVYPLPFLKTAPPAFQLVARVEGHGEPYTLVADSRKASLTLGAGDMRGFFGFLRMGMGHIGAMPEEWRDLDGSWHLPEGLDHIFFVLALVVGGGTFWGLLKNVSGFTLGHSITLALSTLKIIHVHSRWVEAFIALSIAWMAASALIRREGKHRWVIAALFGTVHGLGFASALQELDLARGEILSALLGFNVGVELGQCLIVCAVLPALVWMKRWSNVGYVWTNRGLATGLFLVGSYWFLLRAVN